jgi:hypothetical protein
MAHINRSREELLANLISQAEVEFMRAQLRYEEYVNDLNAARIVNLAVNNDESLLVDSEKALLKEDKSEEMSKKVDFWKRRLKLLQEYEIGNFR